jgi:Tfp pilus assembly protein PilP
MAKVKQATKPWKIMNPRGDRIQAFGTVDVALAKAIWMMLIEGAGATVQVSNYEDHVAYRVVHIMDGQILIQRMIASPDGRWFMQ